MLSLCRQISSAAMTAIASVVASLSLMNQEKNTANTDATVDARET